MSLTNGDGAACASGRGTLCIRLYMSLSSYTKSYRVKVTQPKTAIREEEGLVGRNLCALFMSYFFSYYDLCGLQGCPTSAQHPLVGARA